MAASHEDTAVQVVKELFRMGAEFSINNLTDPAYWLGIGTVITAVMTTITIFTIAAVLKGGATPLGGYMSKFGQGFYYVWKGIFPDNIGAAMYILRNAPNKRLEFDIDYAMAEMLISDLTKNAYRAYRLRQTWKYSCEQDSLVRFTPYGPKHPNVWRLWRPYKHPTKEQFKTLRVYIVKRYERLYRPVQASAGNLTNINAIRALRNEPMRNEYWIAAKTFKSFDGHDAYHRVHYLHEYIVKQWPKDQRIIPHMDNPEYLVRYLYSCWLVKMYKRYPWRFGKIKHFVPPEQAAKVRPLDLGYQQAA